MAPSVRRSTLHAVLTGMLALVDVAFAWLGWLMWTLHRDGPGQPSEAATFVLLGVSALVGAIVMLVATAAFLRGRRSAARAAAAIAWFRALTVVAVLAVLAGALGSSAILGLVPATGAAIAVADAIFAVLAAGAALRRTADG
jgi:Kef-type K+ transport system membrane component KefB